MNDYNPSARTSEGAGTFAAASKVEGYKAPKQGFNKKNDGMKTPVKYDQTPVPRIKKVAVKP